VDADYIRESILEPEADVVRGFGIDMPDYSGGISDREIEAVIAFMKTLSPHGEASSKGN